MSANTVLLRENKGGLCSKRQEFMRYLDKRKSISDSKVNLNIENNMYLIQERTRKLYLTPLILSHYETVSSTGTATIQKAGAGPFSATYP